MRHHAGRNRLSKVIASVITGVTVVAFSAIGTPAAGTRAAGLPAAPTPAAGHLAAGSGGHELTVNTRLPDRRTVVTGTRFYEVGAADASYPATGWHIRGEMGGFWTPPIKLLDGLWFGVDGAERPVREYATGWGYTRMDLGRANGVA